MGRYFYLLGAVVLFSVLASYAVMVDGHCLLENQEDHAGSKIIFTAISPSAVTDSTWTNAAGYYNRDLAAGVYDVAFSHENFIPYGFEAQIFLSATTLDTVVLVYQPLPELIGDLSGTIGPGDYLVTGDIRIPSGSSLTIAPGTRLLFEGSYQLVVRGVLNAVGTAEDSIVFTRCYPAEDYCWRGIYFQFYDEAQSRLEYCTVEWCLKPELGPPHSYGGGILIYMSSPTIAHCRIQNNRTTSYISSGNGGGLASVAGSPVVTDCDISFNTVSLGSGGGVFCGGGAARFERCTIHHNSTANAWSGGGVTIDGADENRFLDCLIFENQADGGGGITLYTNAMTIFTRCIITGNSARNGSAIRCTSDSARFERCTISGGGMFDDALVSMAVSKSTFSSCIISLEPEERGLRFGSSPNAVFRYNDIFGDPQSLFSFADDDPLNGPPAIGIAALTNANGDSCDTYYNIFLDPQFDNPSAGNYHLTFGSPCIDAGDPLLEFDPDNTVADMGAFYFDQLVNVGNQPITALSDFRLAQNYPNPFNPATEIAFTLPHAARATLTVYDVLGRQVALLENSFLPAGEHRRVFSGSSLPSGVYFYTLESADFRATKKMILLK